MAALPPWCTGNLVPYGNPDYCSDPNIEKEYLKCNGNVEDREELKLLVNPDCTKDPYRARFESWVNDVIKLLKQVKKDEEPETFKSKYSNIPLPLWAVYAARVVAQEKLTPLIANYAKYLIELRGDDPSQLTDGALLETLNKDGLEISTAKIREIQTTDYASNYYPVRLQKLVNAMRNAENPMYYPPLVPPVQLVTAPAVLF